MRQAARNSSITTETVVTGASNTLDNVVVYISAGADDAAAPSQAVTFTQKGCQYIPHVIALHTGQELQVINADQTSHNIHPLAKVNHEWNKSQPPGSPAIQDKFDQPEFISVKCNIHPWMHGWFAVLKNQSLFDQRRWRRILAAQFAAGKVHRDCMA